MKIQRLFLSLAAICIFAGRSWAGDLINVDFDDDLVAFQPWDEIHSTREYLFSRVDCCLAFFCGLYFSRSIGGPSIARKIRFDETLSDFTPLARQVVALARAEAARFNHNFLGTEHLLLGLIKLDKGVAVNVLQKIGMNMEIVRMEVENLVGCGPGEKMIGDIPFTPRVKKALSLAADEAKALNHCYIGTEHILLGLLREGDGVAARVLKNMNVNVEQVRQEILKQLDPNFEC